MGTGQGRAGRGMSRQLEERDAQRAQMLPTSAHGEELRSLRMAPGEETEPVAAGLRGCGSEFRVI